MSYLSNTGRWALFGAILLFLVQAYYMITLKAQLDSSENTVVLLRENSQLSMQIVAANQKLADMYLKIGASYKSVLIDIMDKLDAAKVTRTRGAAIALLERIDSFTINQARAALGGS